MIAHGSDGAMKMSRKVFPIILIAAIAAMLCLALAACGGVNNYLNTYTDADKYSVADRGEVKSADIRNLDIEWYNGAVVLQRGEIGADVTFGEVAEGEEKTSDTTMHYYVEDKTLHIRYSRSGKVSLGKLKKYLYVTVPYELTLGEVDIKCVAANITVKDITAREVELESYSGAIRAECTATEVDVQTTSGDAYVKCNASEIDVETVSGELTVICGRLPLHIDIESMSGDVLLRLADYRGFRLSFETANDLFVNAFSNEEIKKEGGRFVFTYLTGKTEDGAYDYEVKTGSGRLTLAELEINMLG